MTADERLEALLNRAGQTISDLPTTYSDENLAAAADAADAWSHRISWRRYCDYIFHLTDVIDRMETALEYAIGERDYLAYRFAQVDCDCDICEYKDMSVLEDPCAPCDIGRIKFELAGVPEYWSIDDADG